MREIIDLVIKIVSSKLWYLLTSLALISLLRSVFTNANVSDSKLMERVRKTAQLTILISICVLLLVLTVPALLLGFKGDLGRDLHMAVTLATLFILLAIFLASRLTRKQGKPEIEEGLARVYTTNNEHEAQLVRVGLEGRGIKVILQRKSAANTPNSLIHQLEIYVFEKDKDKAIELLPKFRP